MKNITIPSQTPIVNSTGRVNNDWLIFFNQIYKRIGGSESLSNSEIQDILSRMQESITAFQQNNTRIDLLLEEFSTNIYELNQDMYDIKIFQNNINNIIENLSQVNINNSQDIIDLQNDVTNIENHIITGGENLGDGEIVFKDKSLENLRFKTLKAGSNVTLTSDDNTITIDSSESPNTNGENLGDGEIVFKDKLLDNLRFKTLKAGSNVTLTSDDDTITIDSSGGGGGSINLIEGEKIKIVIDGIDYTISYKLIPSDTVQTYVFGDIIQVINLTNTALDNRLIIKGGTYYTESTNTMFTVPDQTVLSAFNNLENKYVIYDVITHRFLLVPQSQLNSDFKVLWLLKFSALGVEPEIYDLRAGGSEFGYKFFQGTTTGTSFNFAYGTNSMLNNTSGNYNAAFGHHSLRLNNTGNYNAAFGAYSLTANTNGTDNAAFGYNSLFTNTGGTTNSAFGSHALFINNNGTGNAAFGAYSLRTNNNGSYNSAFGYNSLRMNAGSFYNSAFGNESMYMNSSGGSNAALGNASLYNNTSGSTNTALGNASLYNNINGSNNVAVGANTLRNVSDKSRNSAFGTEAGYFGNGNNNTYVGYRAGYSATVLNYSNVTCVGSLSSVTGDNQIQLGDSTTTTYVYGTVQTRSDKRDKIDTGEIENALEIVRELKPRKYKLNPRERYVDYIDHFDENGELIETEVIKVENDGSRSGVRDNFGYYADEVIEILKKYGIDVSLYQDHTVKGGEDVKTIAYEQFIPLLNLAIQILDKNLINLEKRVKDLENK